MRLSQPCSLNDPHDALIAIRSRLEEQGGEERVLADDFNVEKYYAQRAREEFSRQLGVLCFSSTRLSVLMWSHYAASHSGFVLHFKVSDSFFNRNMTWRDRLWGLEHIYEGLPHPSAVIYSKARKVYYMEDGIPWDVLFQKSKHWSYEREYRSLMNLSDAELVQETKDDRWPVYLIHFPRSVLAGVTLGLAASEDTSQAVISNCKRLGVPVFQIKPEHLSFTLKPEPILEA